jgi:hypothetical protein
LGKDREMQKGGGKLYIKKGSEARGEEEQGEGNEAARTIEGRGW